MKTRYKHGGKNRKKHGGKFRKKEYGIGGAVMTLGKNLLQGKKLGSGALKGVLRAGITPGSGISAGIGLAGAGLSKIGEKTGREGLQKLGKGVGMAGNIAGMFTGGGGGAGAAGALGKGGIDTFLHGAGKQVQGGVLPFLAQKFMGEEGMKVPYAYGGKMRVMKEGGLVGGQKNLDKNNDGEITGEDFKMLRSMMIGGKMNVMKEGRDRGLKSEPAFNMEPGDPSSKQQPIPQAGSSPAGDPPLGFGGFPPAGNPFFGFGRGGKVYEDGGEVEPLTDEENGGEVEPLTDEEFRKNEKFQRQADLQKLPYERSRNVEKLLGKLENNEKVDERAQILRQLVRILGIAGTGILGTTLAGDKLGYGEEGWQRIGIGGKPI